MKSTQLFNMLLHHSLPQQSPCGVPNDREANANPHHTMEHIAHWQEIVSHLWVTHTLEEAFNGGPRAVQSTREKPCPKH